MTRVLICFLSCFLARVSSGQRWQESQRPKMVSDYLKQQTGYVHTFLGNQTHTDHFKLLNQDGSSLLIGARNVVFNISLSDLSENTEQRIEWSPRTRDTELCLVKGKSEEDCNNYIRVLAKVDSEQLLVCGTNAYNPRCRNYEMNEAGVYEVARERSGKGYTPYDPRNNSTFIFTGGELYSATVADFSGGDALIIRDQIRTEQYNLKQLNRPDFVGSVEDEDYVYFFFREDAVENMNCAKEIFSRVGRVCKKDAGGPRRFRNKWTTFVKARLNCSVPGLYPFHFNQIQSVSPLIKSPAGEERVFAVFNTPENSITGSAVCSFSMDDIRDSFDSSPFKVQRDVNSNWLPLPQHQEPRTRPGKCHQNSRDLEDEHLNFVKENILMDRSVPSILETPHYIKTNPHERLTAIAADPGLVTTGGEVVDVLYVGTTRGRVLKLVSQGHETTLIEEIQLFPLHVSVTNILVVPQTVDNPRSGRLVVLSEHEVKSFPLARCEAADATSCGSCVGLRDPYCAWSVPSQACVSPKQSQEDSSVLLQNMGQGRHQGCPATYSGSSDGFYAVDAEFHNQKSLQLSIISGHEPYFQDVFPGRWAEGPHRVPSTTGRVFSEKTLGLACTSAAFLALLIGFLSGFCFSRTFQRKETYLKCDHPYQSTESKWPREEGKGGFLDSGYNTTTSTTKNNLLINMPEKSDPTKASILITKNKVMNKCKKIYL